MITVFLVVGCLSSLISCKDDTTDTPASTVELKSHSVTPALVKNVASGVTVYSLFSSEDVLPNSPNFVFGGTADGAGLLKNSDGTFTMIVNNEDNFSVSRVTLDKSFKPVSGEYLVNSDIGKWRLCSATLATPETHGFGPTFLTCGESGAEPAIHAIDPKGAIGNDKLVTAFGHWLAEQALPLPKDAYTGKTVILIGDDDSRANPNGGNVGMYVGTTGDLDNGNLYVLARKDNNTRERDMKVGNSYDVEFRQIPNQKSMTQAEMDTKVAELKALILGRTEDVDYRRGSGNSREIYFAVTGQPYSGGNADSSRTRKGRIYKLVLNASDPLKGTLSVIIDGDDPTNVGGQNTLCNPDNVTVTENYIYIQEDENEYGDEPHDGRLLQYNISSNTMKTILEIDHHRGDTKYDDGSPTAKNMGSWESSGMIDISDIVGIPGTFQIGIQAHTWKNDKFKGVDGGSAAITQNQGSQILILKGLDR